MLEACCKSNLWVVNWCDSQVKCSYLKKFTTFKPLIIFPPTTLLPTVNASKFTLTKFRYANLTKYFILFDLPIHQWRENDFVLSISLLHAHHFALVKFRSYDDFYGIQCYIYENCVRDEIQQVINSNEIGWQTK